MANIVISFSHVLSNKGYPPGTFPVFYDHFINELKNLGNNIYYIDNVPMSLKIKKQNERILISKIKKLHPDLIILFNNRFPDIDLSKHFDCPIIIYGVDTVLLYSNIDTLKNNNTYKYIVSSSDDIKSLKETLNVSEDRILKIPFFTGIKAEKTEIKNNIVFIGSCWDYTNLISEFTKLNPTNSEISYLNEIIKEIEENPFIQESNLKAKYQNKSENLVNIIDINKILWFISSTKRVKILSKVSALGLKIYGTKNWRNLSFYPELSLAYSPELIYSVKQNQDCYNSAKIGISTSHAQAVAAFPWRITDIMASNACLVTDYHSDFEKYFPGLEIPTYKTQQEAYDICKYLLNNEKERLEIVKECNNVINKNFRFANHLADIEAFTGVKLRNNTQGEAKFLPILNNKKQNKKLTTLEKFFSLTNTKDKKHKIITVMGVKIKIKREPHKETVKWKSQ